MQKPDRRLILAALSASLLPSAAIAAAVAPGVRLGPPSDFSFGFLAARAKKNASAIGATHLGKAGRGNPRQRPEALRVRRVEQARDDVLRTAMSGLPTEQLALVRMAFFESLSHSEIAEKTGLPLGTVKSRIRLAFTRLRRALEANGVVEAN